MSIGSPTALLLWAILSCIFFIFLIVHLWCYDKFNCLRWNSGRQPGAFKRVMTYSYLATLPLLVFFSVAITVFKFKEGFVQTPYGQIIPRPLSLWQAHHKKWVVPLYFVFSVGWSLEIVTHLEELTFWIFLLNQGQVQREWFHSWEFRVWYLGSITSILGMPLVTVITRYNPVSCLAWIMVAGSSASTLTTILFLYVLYRFPGFIRFVKVGGAEPEVVIRLIFFYQLNLARVIFRFLFTIPLFIIGVDGVQGSHQIDINPFGADFLIMLGGFGCFVSSAITLFIFFPRSIGNELGYKSKEPSVHDREKGPNPDRSFSVHSDNSSHEAMPNPFPFTAQNLSDLDATPMYNHVIAEPPDIVRYDAAWDAHGVARTSPYATSPYPQSLQRHSGMPASGTSPSHETSISPVNLHPYVMNFTSPIDLLDLSELPHAM